MSSSNCTIVTAFYNLENKKYITEAYIYWINNYLPYIDSYMIIFTDKNSYDFIKESRKNYLNKTNIIILDIKDFYTYKYLDIWKKHLDIDHEKNIHNIELYMIWNEKANFIDKAIDYNPFNTEFFIWTDIGMIRESYYINHIKSFPNDKIIKSLKKNKVYLLNVDNFIKDDDYNLNLPTNKFRYINCIGGGVIGGHKNILKTMILEYYNMLENMINNDIFVGKDQSIYANLCLKNKNLFELIKPIESPFNNNWFYLLYYFC